MARQKQHITKTLAVSILAGVFVFLCCRFFIIDVARVDSLSMSGTLKPNSLVLIRPISFLSSALTKNDVVQIETPFTENDTALKKGSFFKRIIALPGDTLSIRGSLLYINGKAEEINADLLHNYVIKFKQQKDTLFFTEEKDIEKYLIDDSCTYLVTLTNTRFLDIKSKGISIVENREDSGLYDESIFPNSPKIKWNKDFFGPLYIPKKNDTIKLDTTNIALYKKLITGLEGNSLEIKEGKITINQTEATYYIVKQDYYFVIGDNFDNAIDSRYWGFIPKSAIRAKLIK